MKNVHDAHISTQLAKLHRALLDIVAGMNQPQRDVALIEEAGIALDRALFPLLVNVDRFGPIGVVDLADRVGRDYTTVSRQIARLDELGLVERRAGATDRRVREAIVTPTGKVMNEAINAARERIARAVFGTWEVDDLDTLVRLIGRFAEALTNRPETRR